MTEIRRITDRNYDPDAGGELDLDGEEGDG